MSKKQRTKRRLTHTILLSEILGNIICYGNRDMADIKYSTEQIIADIPSLNSVPHTLTDSARYYFNYYGLAPEDDIAGVEHSFGTFQSQDFTIAAHIYKPASPKGTVVIMHGYLNHCGQLKYAIRNLLENGYAVCAYDMPGHGLSTGKDAWMDDFGTYAKVMHDFKSIVAERCPGPYSVMGFSHGACPIIQANLESEENFFDKTILIAPLVRPSHWRHAQFCYRLYWPFKDSVIRIASRNTSDQEFLDFNKSHDFLHKQRVPLMWVRALEKWISKITSLPAIETKLMVIQGDKDSTVDFKYNMKFLGEKFDAKEVILKKAKHELFNESKEIKSKVFTEINSYLENNTK